MDRPGKKVIGCANEFRLALPVPLVWSIAYAMQVDHAADREYGDRLLLGR